MYIKLYISEFVITSLTFGLCVCLCVCLYININIYLNICIVSKTVELASQFATQNCFDCYSKLDFEQSKAM